MCLRGSIAPWGEWPVMTFRPLPKAKEPFLVKSSDPVREDGDRMSEHGEPALGRSIGRGIARSIVVSHGT